MSRNEHRVRVIGSTMRGRISQSKPIRIHATSHKLAPHRCHSEAINKPHSVRSSTIATATLSMEACFSC